MFTYLLLATLVAMVCALSLALIDTRTHARRTARALANVTAHRDYWRAMSHIVAPFAPSRIDWNASNDDIHRALTGRDIPTTRDDDAREFVRVIMSAHGFHTN